MGVLDTVVEPEDGPIICTILGDAGRGKTSLAATFPKPIFIRAEDGLKSIPKGMRPKAFPVLTSVDDLWEQLMGLLRDEHIYETVVIDSVTALDRWFIESILAKEKPGTGLQQSCGGYGSGFDVLAAMHQRVRKACGLLASRRGMNVVFTAHTDTVRVEPPDSDAYMSYTLRLANKKSFPFYVDDVDLVGNLRLETFIKGKEGERRQAVSNGDRELICTADAASVSKNRFGITDPIPVKLGENPLAPFFPALAGPKNETKPKAAGKKAPANKDESQ